MSDEVRATSWFRNILPHLAPFVGVAIAYSLYRTTYHLAKIDDVTLDVSGWGSVKELAIAGPNLAARLRWQAASILLVVVWAVAIRTGLVIIWRSLAMKSAAWRWAAVAFAVMGAAFLWQGTIDDPLSLPRLRDVLVDAFTEMEMQGELWLIYVPTAMSVAAGFILLVACSATLAGSRSAPDLGGQKRRLKEVLYAGACVMAGGTLQAATLHQLPVSLLADPAAEAVTSVANAFSTFTGFLWSLLIFSMYLPCALVIDHRAQGLAKTALEKKECSSVRKWLGDQGLSESLPQQTVQLIAVLAPLIAGGVVPRILGMFGGG